MSDLNKVMLIGRLGGKPELLKTASGAPVCRLSVATSHGSQRDGRWERTTTWHKVVTFDRLAELCSEFLDKGRLVFVEGALRATEWKDKDGIVHHGREVRASHVRFLGAPSGDSSDSDRADDHGDPTEVAVAA